MGKVTSTKDLIMLLLYAQGHRGQQYEPIRGRTRLMKMVFLFDKEIRKKFNLDRAVPKDAIPQFKPYLIGPFSVQVFNDLEFLVDMGLVGVKHLGDAEPLPEEELEYDYWQAGAAQEDDEDRELLEEEFFITKLGQEFVKDELFQSLSHEQWRVLDEFKRRCTGTPLRALLKYVYSKYPSMTTESKIRDEILAE